MTWANVQTAVSPGATSGTSLSLAYTSNVTSGNLLVAIMWMFPNTLVLGTPTDTVGNTWVPLGTQINDVNTEVSLQAWATFNTSSAANTVAVAWTGGAAVNVDLVVTEFSGISTALTQDGARVSATATSSATVNAPTFTPTVAGDLLILTTQTSTNTVSITSPWTQVGTATPQTAAMWGWLADAGTTAETAAGTTASGDWMASIAGIQAVGTGGAGLTLNISRVN